MSRRLDRPVRVRYRRGATVLCAGLLLLVSALIWYATWPGSDRIIARQYEGKRSERLSADQNPRSAQTTIVANTERLEVAGQRDTAVQMTFLDTWRHPIPGAKVTAHRTGNESSERAIQEVSDATGRVTALCKASLRYDFAVEHPQFRSLNTQILVGDKPESLEFILALEKWEARVTVSDCNSARVLDYELSPIPAVPGILVDAMRVDGGRSVLIPVTIGQIDIACAHKDYAWSVVSCRQPNGVRSVDVQIVLERGKSLYIGVSDAGGNPVAGATVRPAQFAGVGVETNGEGIAKLECIPQHLVRVPIAVHKEGYGLRMASAQVGADWKTNRVTLLRVWTVSGMVEAGGGRAVSDALVEFVCEGDTGVTGSGRSGESGEFRIAGVWAGRTLVIVRKKGFIRKELSVVIDEGGGYVGAIALQEAMQVGGRVQNIRGDGLAMARVQAMRGGRRDGDVVSTDNEGRYVLDTIGELPEGLDVRARGYVPIVAEWRMGGVVTLEECATISGRIVESGRALDTREPLFVRVLDGIDEHARAMFNRGSSGVAVLASPDGVWRIGDTLWSRDKEVVLGVYRKGCAETIVRYDASKGDVVVYACPLACGVTARVYNGHSGGMVSVYRVFDNGKRVCIGRKGVDSRGLAKWSNLECGDYLVSYDGGHGQSIEKRLRTSAGEECEVVLGR